jgi:hypothetical protein
VNQSFGPVNLSNSSLGSYSTSKASASLSGTRGEYRMAPNRKSPHESALNCCETTLHLYLFPGAPSFILTFSIYRETDFPTARCNRRQNLLLKRWYYTTDAVQLLRITVVIQHH